LSALPTREEIAEIVRTVELPRGYLVPSELPELMADALLARLRPAWEPQTPEEIHKKLGAMMDEEERLLNRLEELGDTTYAISDECVERTRKNLTVIMDLTQQRDALRADLERAQAIITHVRVACDDDTDNWLEHRERLETLLEKYDGQR